MSNLFLPILEMSVTGGIVILAVILIRLLLKGAPKIYSYLLWSIAAFRLCCPISFQSDISIFNFRSLNRQTEDVIPAITQTAVSPHSESVDLMSCIASVWLCGMVLLLIYGIVTYYRLKVKLNKAVLIYDNVYCAQGLFSPFVMGVTSPRIYIPFDLNKENEEYILKHERTHIRRLDHIVKLLAFGILCVHWFNPLCWIAFILMSRDMEMSCDEKVLKGGSSIKVYSNALLSMATRNRFPSPGPISFGEVSVKQRIMNILHWKKPAIWITVISVIICIGAVSVCATDPIEVKTEPPKTPEISQNQTLPDTTDTITADTTTIDTTTADTTTIDTTTADTTTADTTTANIMTEYISQTEKINKVTTKGNADATQTTKSARNTDASTDSALSPETYSVTETVTETEPVSPGETRPVEPIDRPDIDYKEAIANIYKKAKWKGTIIKAGGK